MIYPYVGVRRGTIRASAAPSQESGKEMRKVGNVILGTGACTQSAIACNGR